MPGQNTLILASDYNTLQTQINDILGTTSNGYGQSVTSSQITGSPLPNVTALQWNNLRTDLLKARQHQLGTSGTATLTQVTNLTIISEALRSEYATVSTAANTNRYSIGVGEFTDEVNVTATRTTSWKNSVTHTIHVTWPSLTNLRYFFNAGGQIRITSSRTGAASTSKDTSWSNLLSNLGTIVCGRSAVTQEGGGTGTTLYQNNGANAGIITGLPYTQQTTIVDQYASAGTYAENYLRIIVGVNTAGYIQINMYYIDADTGDQTGLGPPVDEFVTGTLTSTISLRRPTGSNVSLAAPTGSVQVNGGS